MPTLLSHRLKGFINSKILPLTKMILRSKGYNIKKYSQKSKKNEAAYIAYF